MGVYWGPWYARPELTEDIPGYSLAAVVRQEETHAELVDRFIERGWVGYRIWPSTPDQEILIACRTYGSYHGFALRSRLIAYNERDEPIAYGKLARRASQEPGAWIARIIWPKKG